MIEISPAILTNDVSDFRKKYAELFGLSHYFTKLHVDFIDDKFIHNKTVMPSDLGFLKSSPLILVAHFMTLEPQKYFEEAKAAGFKWVIFHLEAFQDDSEIDSVIAKAKKLDLRAGLAINAETPLHAAGKFIQKFEMIQLMGIHPGFQGRPFMSSTFDKIKELRSLSKSVIISVDGGVKVGVARQCAQAGANILVAGSAIGRSEDAEMAIEALKADIET
jgi:ribulose-phosphate 3-epimerase